MIFSPGKPTTRRPLRKADSDCLMPYAPPAPERWQSLRLFLASIRDANLEPHLPLFHAQGITSANLRIIAHWPHDAIRHAIERLLLGTPVGRDGRPMHGLSAHEAVWLEVEIRALRKEVVLEQPHPHPPRAADLPSRREHTAGLPPQRPRARSFALSWDAGVAGYQRVEDVACAAGCDVGAEVSAPDVAAGDIGDRHGTYLVLEYYE
ncbi:unnamed protein product [Mycena citricolor]|uniref:Uncharacterized protein n=1 Tax=Mycena citricolor TaxID=2018698 RepID=A0AAD2K6Y1_9AGAR|nr:unnamed protein product [Mycena citricolor]